ncbi:MAG: Diadenosine tetraphosphate (Ap4A) hydrolase [Nocardioides sp.]|nr:Diadenosine tetraphosphate (Ap4A) hydrolase [Nocardioides sp.]
MPESAEEVHARVVAAVGESGHLPMPELGEWDVFPWVCVDGAVAPRALPAPAVEPTRQGEDPAKPCGTCAGFDPDRIVWEDDYWVLTHDGQPSGLPLVVVLHTREHLDFPDLDDDLASQLGRISTRLTRIIGSLPHIGRVHMSRWGDGGSHFHLWFFARTEGLATILGSYAVEWDEILPPGPEDIWREDLHTVASKLANWGGHARA